MFYRFYLLFAFLVLCHTQTKAYDCYLARVFDTDSKQYYYIDQTGELAFEQAFLMAYDFSEGCAFVLQKDSTWTLINQKGEVNYTLPDSIGEITTLYRIYSRRRYERVKIDIQLRDSILRFQANYSYNNFGFIYFHIRKGILFKDRHFLSAQNFSEEKAYATFYDSSGRKSGYIDLNGDLVIDLSSRFINHDAGEFYDGLAVLFTASEEVLDSCWLMDTSGNLTQLIWGSNYNSSKSLSSRMSKKNSNNVFVDDDFLSKNYLPNKDAPKSYLRRCYHNENYNSIGKIGYCNKYGKLKLELPDIYQAKGEFIRVNCTN